MKIHSSSTFLYLLLLLQTVQLKMASQKHQLTKINLKLNMKAKKSYLKIKNRNKLKTNKYMISKSLKLNKYRFNT